MTRVSQFSAAEHPVKSVTIFKSAKAEVVRTFSLSLKPGQNRVEISRLSSSIDTDSVRISGLGSARLLDVVCTLQDPETPSDTGAANPTELFRLLSAQKSTLEAEARLRGNEEVLLDAYARTLNAAHVPPAAAAEFLAGFAEQGARSVQAGAVLQEQIVEVEREMARVKHAEGGNKGEARARVAVTLLAGEEEDVEVKLTYIVSNASWEPAYELHATTALDSVAGNKPAFVVSLHYRARVRQATGEDWAGAALTLSTVSTAATGSLPIFRPLKIRERARGALFGARSTATNPFGQQLQQTTQPAVGIFGQQVPMGQQQGFGAFGQQPLVQTQAFQPAGAATFGGSSAPNTSLFGSNNSEAAPALPPPVGQEEDETFEEVAAPGPFSTPRTIVSESPLALTYSVEGAAYTIPSDDVPHQVAVAVLSFDARVTYVVVPRVDRRVFLQCEVKNTSEYRLLPGSVNVFLDDSFVSKTTINDVNTGDAFTCMLGTDPSTRVTYTRTLKSTRTQGGAFAEARNTTVVTATTTLHNMHRFVLGDIIVRDGVPVAEASGAQVVVQKPEGLAGLKEGEKLEGAGVAGMHVRWSGRGGEKEGRYEWVGAVGAEGRVVMSVEWEVRALADLAWIESA